MEEKKQKHFYNFKCSTCGHEWRSYGFGKRIVCPKCYEAKTGKKLGQSTERMAEVRAMRNKKQPKEEPAAVSEDTVMVAEREQPEREVGTWTPGGGNDDSKPQPEPKPAAEPRQPNALEKLLGFRIS